MSNFEFKELSKTENFDPSVIYSETPFTQASFYGDWQKKLGRVVKRFVVKDKEKALAFFQIIKYPLLLEKSYLYIPYGPVTNDFSEDFLRELKKELLQIAKNESAVFVRLDFSPSIDDEKLKKFFKPSSKNTYHSALFQPRLEGILKLNPSAEDLIINMHKNTRYSINVSEKKDIKTEIITSNFENYFETFYNLMLETSNRNGFSLHKKEYYQNIFQSITKENAFLSIAKYEEKILAVNLIIKFGKIANYVFSGTSNEERDRLPAYGALWRAIKYSKEIGAEAFNFGGISDGDKTYHGWEGLTSFKKKFGGEVWKHSDFFDLVANPFWYYLYNIRKLLKSFRN